MGCSPRRHTPGPPSDQSAGIAKNQGLLRPHARGAAPDVRDPAHDDEAASRAAGPHIPSAHRHRRGGRRKRTRRARQQSHEDRSTADATVTQAKSCLIDTTARLGHSKWPRLSASQADKGRATPNRTEKIARYELADSGILRNLVPNLSA